MSPDAAGVAAALDERHAAAHLAYAARDVAAYAELFDADLRYTRADGATIGRDRLMRDVAAQFRRLDRATSAFTRERLEVDGMLARETGVQLAVAEARAFGVVRRSWHVERRASYDWALEGGEWRIVRVHVADERVTGRWCFGR